MNGGTLAPLVAAIRLRAEAAVLRRLNAGAGLAAPRIQSQIYLRDAAAQARIAGGTLRPQSTHAKAIHQVQAAIGAGEALPERVALAATRLGLDAHPTG